jgi:DNA-directed RNA polymerase specialized sigma24 family protein
MNYGEIAERMGVTTHAVKKYVMQGLALCRKRLGAGQGGAG